MSYAHNFKKVTSSQRVIPVIPGSIQSCHFGAREMLERNDSNFGESGNTMKRLPSDIATLK